MKKSIKNFLLIFLVTLLVLNPILYTADAFSDLSILKNSSNTCTLPQHFRKSTDNVPVNETQPINLLGLNNLNISGSGQFSENNLTTIKDSIGDNFSIIDIDLRQEFHGFVNGIAISFENEKNNSNIGLSRSEVINDECKKLETITIDEPIAFSNDGTIIAKEVENECTVTNNNNITYIRIPVTDGGLPNDDDINYFINIIKKQPKDSWIHFHCKAGLGRTTTFMTMYDIIKNCNEVSLNDIITRQILLSTMPEKDTQSFYTGKHFAFLNDFYTKCKSNEFNIFSSQINDSYIKNSIQPKYLYVISEKNMTKEEQTMVSTLQGIVATKSDKQIYIVSPNEPDYETWLKDLKLIHKVKYKIIKDPWKLLSKFKSSVDGYVLYNASNSPSINNACSLASLTNSIAIDKTLESKVNTLGISKLTKDCSDTDKYWAFNNLWNNGLNHSIVIELSPDKPISLRDYAIVSKSLIFYEDSNNDTTLREKVFKSLDNSSHCLGWGPDEHDNVSLASTYGVDVIAADWSYNLSVLSSYPSTPLTQKSKDDIPTEDGFHYVTFIMSDGDNQQWFLGNNYTSPKWYGSSNRGNFNLGWSISPSIYYLAPTVFNKYYESASCDNYVVPPSGNGYMYPSKFPIDKLSEYTNRLSDYMTKVDQNNVLILDDDSFYNQNLWDKYTYHNNINGLFYLNYRKHNEYEGKILWSNDKPIVSCRDLLWGGLEDETTVVNNIKDRINLGYTNVTDPNSYTFVYVHVWSNTLDNVQAVVDKLNVDPKVKVVTPDVFINLIHKNVSH